MDDAVTELSNLCFAVYKLQCMRPMHASWTVGQSPANLVAANSRSTEAEDDQGRN
jgi:hypothetical protein